MNVKQLIEKYLNNKVTEEVNLLSDQKTLMNSVKQFIDNNNKVTKITQKSKGKYIEQIIKCKNNKVAKEFVQEFKDFAIKNGLLSSPAPFISPTKEFRFYRRDQVLVMFLDYTNAGGSSNSSLVKLYYPKSNK